MKDQIPLPRQEKLYIICCVLFCVLLALTNLIGLKIVRLPFAPSLALTTSLMVYPLTFLLSDVVTEIWGQQRARFMVILGFIMCILTIALAQAALHLPPHPYWLVPGNPYGYTELSQYQTAYSAVFGTTHFVLVASLMAYLVAQLLDVSIFGWIKRLTDGRYLFLRNNLSTWIAQLADTIVVNSIILYLGFHLDFSRGLQIMASCFLVKVLIAILETPLLYLTVRWIRQRSVGSVSP